MVLSKSPMERLLKHRIPTIQKILQITQDPGVSIGVIHNGKVTFTYNTGVADIGSGREVNSDTLYCIASLSKAFMAACLDILVQEGKISWDTKIGSILPDFKPSSDSVLLKLTLTDICSHRTGLLSLDEITQGLDGRILISKEEVVNVCNALPVKNELRTSFLYNNALFALAGCIVERVSGYSNWGNFMHDRIFQQLGMTRTTAFRQVHATDDNVAKPYVILRNGTPKYFPPTELSADSMNGGSGAVRSSVNDLLKWCEALLSSFLASSAHGSPNTPHSPVFQRKTIGNQSSPKTGDYCLGWCYHQTPAKLGMISSNRDLVCPMLGASSRSHIVYGHQGDVNGYKASLYLVPESQSAVVVLCNGTGHSDGADWIAQDLLQAMLGLEPAVDFVDVASKAAPKYLSFYEVDYKAPLERNRINGTPTPCLRDLIGIYTMKNLDVAFLDVTADQEDSSKLILMVNGQRDQALKMWHYHYDVWCHLPDSFDECISRGIYRDAWSSFLLSFLRKADGSIAGLRWNMSGVDVYFVRAE